MMVKQGRNDPCACGSGKKYKKCCLAMETTPVLSLNWQKMRRTEGELIPLLLKHAEKWYGAGAIMEAWDEFTLWSERPMDPESQPELDTAYIPWFLFNWIPDNAEVDDAQHLPEVPVAIHFLEKMGSRVDSYWRRFIEEITSQPYSFFVVTDIDHGRRLGMRDLLLGREVSVYERQASTTLRKGAILYSRIVTMDGDSIMVGCAPTVIPPAYLTEFIDIREKITKDFPGFGKEFLLEYDIELRTVYYDILDELHNPALPELRNTDDDPLQLTKLHFLLKCSPRDALDSLYTLAMSVDSDELAGQGGYSREGELLSVEFPWLKKGNRKHAGWKNTVMGNIRINGDRLTVEVNSQKRADSIKRKVARLLGKQVVFKNAVIQSTEKILEDMANKPHDADADLDRKRSKEIEAIPEVQKQMGEMNEQHWKAWLDTPLPVLKEQSPREAAKTALGRERLEALFLQFEHGNESPRPFSPDVQALRKSLGLD